MPSSHDSGQSQGKKSPSSAEMANWTERHETSPAGGADESASGNDSQLCKEAEYTAFCFGEELTLWPTMIPSMRIRN